MSKRRRRSFDIAPRRRREIVRDAQYVGAADTEDYWRWLVAWAWHNRTSKDQAGALENISKKMGRELGPSEIDEILELAKTTRQRRSADSLARFLGVTYARRQRLKLTTIGAIDVDRKQRNRRRRERNRMAKEARRRARGATPRVEYEANSLTRTEPWKAQGISRRTWERRRRVASAGTANPNLKDGGPNDASPGTAIFLSGEDTPASPKKNQGDFRGEACPHSTAQTARWIAARERLCGLRHNGPLRRRRRFTNP
jgi:hypothetical protein